MHSYVYRQLVVPTRKRNAAHLSMVFKNVIYPRSYSSKLTLSCNIRKCPRLDQAFLWLGSKSAYIDAIVAYALYLKA